MSPVPQNRNTGSGVAVKINLRILFDTIFSKNICLRRLSKRYLPPAAAPISVGNQGAASNATGYPVTKVQRNFPPGKFFELCLLGCNPKPPFQYRQVQKNKSASSHIWNNADSFIIYFYIQVMVFSKYSASQLYDIKS